MVIVDRRVYPILIEVNERIIHKVVIDSHYELKHKESMSDQIILDLVQLLGSKNFGPEDEVDNFQYFKTELL